MDQGTAVSDLTVPDRSRASELGLKAPRGWGWEFFLHFSTLGVYTCFWMVARLRELRRLEQDNVRPWLWFFVPILAIAQIFALPRLTRYLRGLELHHDIAQWGSGRHAWVFLVVAVTVFFHAQESVAMPAWTTLVALILWASLFSLFEARLNAVKRRMNPACFRHRKHGYALWEWFIVVPLFPATIGLFTYASLGPAGFYDESPILPVGQVYEDPGGHFQFPITSDGWAEVTAGTFSDTDSVLELRGPVDHLSAIVFHYKNSTLEELAYDRRATFYGDLSLAECTESRRFAKRTLSVMVNIVCKGRQMGDPALLTSSIVETDDGLYELVTQMNVPTLSFSRLESSVLEMTGAFEPL